MKIFKIKTDWITTTALRRLAILTIFTATLALAANSARAVQADVSLISKDWEEVIAPLQTIPVQDVGFLRSGYTFGENHLMAITGKRGWEGRSPLLMCVWLMADDQAQHNAQIIKVIRPELVKIFGGKSITLHIYNDQANQTKMRELIRSDQEKCLPAANILHYKTVYLEELSTDFAIIPREGEWLSPNELQRRIRSGEEKGGESDLAILDEWANLRKAVQTGNLTTGKQAAEQMAANINTAAEALGVDMSKMKIDVLYHSHKPFAKSAFFFLIAASPGIQPHFL